LFSFLASAPEHSNDANQPSDDSNYWPALPEDDNLDNLDDLPVEMPFYLLNDEEEEIVDDPATAGPSRCVPDADQPPSKKKKPIEQPEKPFLVKCGVCGKKYKTLDGYVKHSFNHRTGKVYEFFFLVI